MFEKAELDHIERLHGIGRQLAVLKRIYQSYDRIISRILERQNLVISELHAATSADPNADGDDAVVAMQASTGDIRSKPYLGVALSAPTIVRFERLKDSINLYALSEIQACLDEKESLVFLVSLLVFWQSRPNVDILYPELQSTLDQGVPSRRALNSDHYSSRKADNPLSTRQSDDWVLLRSDSRPARCLHAHNILGQFRSDHGIVMSLLDGVWISQRYG